MTTISRRQPEVPKTTAVLRRAQSKKVVQRRVSAPPDYEAGRQAVATLKRFKQAMVMVDNGTIAVAYTTCGTCLSWIPHCQCERGPTIPAYISRWIEEETKRSVPE